MCASSQASVTFQDVSDKNVNQLRKLNSVIFPVRYQDKFYQEAVSPSNLAKLAYYGDKCVGAVASRIERRPDGGSSFYIMTLGVLAPYRRLGIGTQLLNECLRASNQESAVDEVYLHVQTNNESALAFYSKFGFEVTATIANYYKRIQPSDCYVLTKRLLPFRERNLE